MYSGNKSTYFAGGRDIVHVLDAFRWEVPKCGELLSKCLMEFGSFRFCDLRLIEAELESSYVTAKKLSQLVLEGQSTAVMSELPKQPYEPQLEENASEGAFAASVAFERLLKLHDKYAIGHFQEKMINTVQSVVNWKQLLRQFGGRFLINENVMCGRCYGVCKTNEGYAHDT
jgi:hypothetical protein